MAIGTRIRSAREKKGLSRKQLAHYIGENHRKIEHFEYGSQRIQADLLPALSSYLGVSMEYLLTGKKSPRTKKTDTHNTINIPLYGDTPVSAGGGHGCVERTDYRIPSL